MSQPEPVPPAVRAQLLATEHWSLLATRSQTWSEVMGRITAQFTFTSAAFVVLALVVQEGGYDGSFRPVALGLGAFVLANGTLTAMRVQYASHEDAGLVRGMNRLRRAYVDLDPGIAPYLVTGWSDDAEGLVRTYTLGPHRMVGQLLASASMFITSVNALVAGSWTGVLLAPLGRAPAVVVGIVAGLAYVAAFLVAGIRVARRMESAPDAVRFPSVPGD